MKLSPKNYFLVFGKDIQNHQLVGVIQAPASQFTVLKPELKQIVAQNAKLKTLKLYQPNPTFNYYLTHSVSDIKPPMTVADLQNQLANISPLTFGKIRGKTFSSTLYYLKDARPETLFGFLGIGVYWDPNSDGDYAPTAIAFGHYNQQPFIAISWINDNYPGCLQSRDLTRNLQIDAQKQQQQIVSVHSYLLTLDFQDFADRHLQPTWFDYLDAHFKILTAVEPAPNTIGYKMWQLPKSVRTLHQFKALINSQDR